MKYKSGIQDSGVDMVEGRVPCQPLCQTPVTPLATTNRKSGSNLAANSQQTRVVGSMSSKCWTSVVDAGSTLK